jgi:hypothetical protein
VHLPTPYFFSFFLAVIGAKANLCWSLKAEQKPYRQLKGQSSSNGSASKEFYQPLGASLLGSAQSA